MKKLVFYSITVSMPFLVLILLEIGLRLFNYGYEYPLFIEDKNDKDYLIINPEISRRYFNESQIQVNSQLELFSKTKSKNEFRIFVLGGSTAAGFPYNHGASFPRQLEYALRQTYSSDKINVINTAITATNTYTLLDFSDEIIAQQPDAVLIYTGHNEYYGAFGVGSTQSLGSNSTVINYYLKYKNFRLIQLLRNAIISLQQATAGNEKQNATLMERMVKAQEIEYNGNLYMAGKDQFAFNIEAILHKYKLNNIPVFIGNIASNLKNQIPFTSSIPSQDSNNWNNHYLKGLKLYKLGKHEDALESFHQASRIDSTNAELFYYMGQCYYINNDSISASKCFDLAKDLDLLRFRAPTEFNAIIAAAAKKHSAEFVDVEGYLNSISEMNIIGDEVMAEHLHPNLLGYSTMAKSYYDALVSSEIIESIPPLKMSLNELVATRPVSSIDSISGNLLIDQLKSGWPFKYKSIKEFNPSTAEERIAFEKYKKNISWPEASNKLYKMHIEDKEYRKAIKTAYGLYQEFPNLAEPKLMLAEAYFENKDYVLAQKFYLVLFYARPDNKLFKSVILCLLKQNKEIKALNFAKKNATFLESNTLKALKEVSQPIADSLKKELWVNKSGAYAFLGEYDKSKTCINEALKIDNNYQEALNLLDIITKMSRNENR